MIEEEDWRKTQTFANTFVLYLYILKHTPILFFNKGVILMT
jgi:hypothetical protein